MNLSNKMNILSIETSCDETAIALLNCSGGLRNPKIKVVKMRTSEEFVDYCRKRSYNIVSVEIGEDSNNIFEYKYPENTMLVIGNEGTGVPKKILDNSVSRVYIPQYGGVECLNASIAGSIAIYDWVRKNNSCFELNTIERKFDTR